MASRPPTARPGSAPVIYVLALCAVPLVWLVLRNVMDARDAPPGGGFVGYLLAMPFLGKVLFATFVGRGDRHPDLVVRVGDARRVPDDARGDHADRLQRRLLDDLFEQAGSSLTLFADRNTDLTLFGLPHLGGADAELQFDHHRAVRADHRAGCGLRWPKRGWEPSIPIKFGLALVGVGVGFVLLVWGGHFVAARFPRCRCGGWSRPISSHSIAELLISPVGLSMITKLSIARVVGLMMGVWFLSISVAEYLAGAIAQATSVQTVGGQVTNMRAQPRHLSGELLDTGAVDGRDRRRCCWR